MKNNTATNNTSNGTITLTRGDFTAASTKARIIAVLKDLGVTYKLHRQRASNGHRGADLLHIPATGVVFSFSLDTLIVWYTDRPTSNTYVPYDFIKGIEQGAGGSNQLEVSSILPFAYTAFDVR